LIAKLINAVTVGPEAVAPIIGNVFESWITWSSLCKNPVKLDADLIFLPCLLEEHFFCVCINFLTKQLEYLDNKKYTIAEGTTFGDLESVFYACLTVISPTPHHLVYVVKHMFTQLVCLSKSDRML
jgi:hypothetical protein